MPSGLGTKASVGALRRLVVIALFLDVFIQCSRPLGSGRADRVLGHWSSTGEPGSPAPGSVMRIRDSREPLQTGFGEAEIALLALDHSLPAELSAIGRKALVPGPAEQTSPGQKAGISPGSGRGGVQGDAGWFS